MTPLAPPVGSAARAAPALTAAGTTAFADHVFALGSNRSNVVVLLPGIPNTPAVWPETTTWPGVSAVLDPRFHVTTLGPAVSIDRTLALVAAGQSTVPLAASAENVYSPRSSSEHVHWKLSPAPPAGTFPL